MIKFGNLTNPIKSVISEIQEIGKNFDFVEIGIEGPLGITEVLDKDAIEIKEEIEKRKLFAIAHTAYYIELGSPYESVRKAYVEEVKKKIDLAFKIGCDKINVHSHIRGMYAKKDRFMKILIANYIKSLKELVDYSNKKKIKFMLENSWKNDEISKFKDIKKILDSVQNLYFHLDIGHAFINGRMREIERYIKTFRHKLIHIHIHDNKGKKDEHKAIGKGKINFKRIVKILKKIKYDNTITIEVFGKNRKPAVNSLKKLKKMLK